VSTMRKRLDSIEERVELQQHRDLVRQTKSRSHDELLFFCIHGYWPENAGKTLPPRMEFTVRGIRTTVTAQWE
jgi:hypothetical protein